MIRCEDCNSLNISQGLTYYIPESLEEVTYCTCNDCRAFFEKYADVLDPDEQRDLRNQAEIAAYERPF